MGQDKMNHPEELPGEQRLDLEGSDFDFSSDEAARESMKTFIRENFSDLLGDRIELLDEPGGIQKIKDAMREEIEQAGKELPKSIEKLLDFLK